MSERFGIYLAVSGFRCLGAAEVFEMVICMQYIDA